MQARMILRDEVGRKNRNRLGKINKKKKAYKRDKQSGVGNLKKKNTGTAYDGRAGHCLKKRTAGDARLCKKSTKR